MTRKEAERIARDQAFQVLAMDNNPFKELGLKIDNAEYIYNEKLAELGSHVDDNPEYECGYKEGKEEAARLFGEADQPTLRDQFAMAALTGLLSHHGFALHHDMAKDTAYNYADVMLAARKGGE